MDRLQLGRVYLIAAAIGCAVFSAMPTIGQSLVPSPALPIDSADFICSTRAPDWNGRYTTAADPVAIPNGELMYYHQDPPILTVAYQGTVALHDFTVVGDRRTMRLYYATTPGQYGFDEFERVTTRSFGGVLVSVFEPSWPMAAFIDRVGRWNISWDNVGVANGLYFAGDTTVPAGQFPSGSQVIFMVAASTSIAPVPVTKVSDTVQFSSHLVNLVIPGFGDDRMLTGTFPLDKAAQKFYETFEDSYDTLVFIPENQQAANFGGFHLNVQNRIEGIGMSTFDNSRSFGSRGALQGVEYQKSINNIGVKHEQAHQWGDYFDWARIGAITVTDKSHTPVWADRETPLPGRVSWWVHLAADGNNGWQSVRAAFPHTFPPMMLYAMGRLPKEEVPPVVLFDDQLQVFGGPGVASRGTFKTRTVNDVIGVSGQRRGPAVANSISRGNIIVSTGGLISSEEMSYWNHLAQRSEDPNGTGVPGLSGDGSFERATGVDLKTDIRPKSRPALAGDRQVDDKPFSRDDVLGVRFDSEIPGRIAAGDRLILRGEITDEAFSGSETLTVRINPYQTSTALVSQSVQVGASRSFEVMLQLPPDQRGVYGLTVQLTRADRATTLAPIAVQ